MTLFAEFEMVAVDKFAFFQINSVRMFSQGIKFPFGPLAEEYMRDWFHQPFMDESCQKDHSEVFAHKLGYPN